MQRKRPINDPFVTRVGERIRSLRLEIGLSMRSLAQKAKCSSGTIVQIELGRSVVTGRLLQKVASGLGVRPLDLLNLDTENDDLGYVIERMRQDPKSRALVNAQLAEWDRGLMQTNKPAGA